MNGSSLTEEKELDIENVSPLKSAEGAYPGKGFSNQSPRARQALFSLQAALQKVSNDTPKSCDVPVEPSNECQDLPQHQVFPHSLATPLDSGSGDGPSQLNLTEEYSRDCHNLEDLPSSKEVSFTLPTYTSFSLAASDTTELEGPESLLAATDKDTSSVLVPNYHAINLKDPESLTAKTESLTRTAPASLTPYNSSEPVPTYEATEPASSNKETVLTLFDEVTELEDQRSLFTDTSKETGPTTPTLSPAEPVSDNCTTGFENPRSPLTGKENETSPAKLGSLSEPVPIYNTELEDPALLTDIKRETSPAESALFSEPHSYIAQSNYEDLAVPVTKTAPESAKIEGGLATDNPVSGIVNQSSSSSHTSTEFEVLSTDTASDICAPGRLTEADIQLPNCTSPVQGVLSQNKVPPESSVNAAGENDISLALATELSEHFQVDSQQFSDDAETLFPVFHTHFTDQQPLNNLEYQSQCVNSKAPPLNSVDLDDTNNLFLDFCSSSDAETKSYIPPAKSLLDTSLSVNDSVTVKQEFASDTNSSEESNPGLDHIEKLVSIQTEQTSTHSSETDLDEVDSTASRNSKKDSLLQDSKANSVCDTSQDISSSQLNPEGGTVFDLSSMPKMDDSWQHDDQMNNSSVDINVNPCAELQGNNLNDIALTTLNHVNSDVGEDSLSSSPNKRKNEEDSAFEDLATDTNSDHLDDHIMDDHLAEVGVAAVSRRSPSVNRCVKQAPVKVAPPPETVTPTFNHSEAGPEVAEFTEEEFRSAAEVFKDPSTFEFLERASNTNVFEQSALSRLSLYVKFDPLVSQKSQEVAKQATFKKPAPPQKKSSPVLESPSGKSISTEDFPPTSRRESCNNKLIDFNSPDPSLVGKSSANMVPVEPMQRIDDMPLKVFTEDDMKKALQINDLLFQERLIKKEKELTEMNRKHQSQVEALTANNSSLQQAISFTRCLMEESNVIMRKWQEKKEEEKSERTRERDQALEDLRNVETSFSELHKRYEKMKAVLEGYKQNEVGLRAQLQDTKEKLANEEQNIEMLQTEVQEKLDMANAEIESARRSGGSEIAVLRSQLMKAEMELSSLEKTLEQKVQQLSQLTQIYDDLVARVSGRQA